MFLVSGFITAIESKLGQGVEVRGGGGGSVLAKEMGEPLLSAHEVTVCAILFLPQHKFLQA